MVTPQSVRTAQTVEEWLEQVADSDESSDQDCNRMQNLLRKVGYHSAVCVLGIVYMKGEGYPLSIHAVAAELIVAARTARADEQTARMH